MAKTLGLHILADLYGVDADKIDRVEDIRELLEGAVKYANLTKISSHYYQFQPHGATGVVLLAESHISIHTWPEHGIATVDVYTCGDPSKAYKAMDYIINNLQPSRVDKQIHDRGLLVEHSNEQETEKLRSILLKV
ncbi:MAG: S-adenosylmethionine decarboxylase [Aquifex sp.]|nr:MAG: S-adenosylmethionine decarboxylase [Aquifex sp.]